MTKHPYPHIAVSHLGFSYQSQNVLNDLSFEVNEGECFLIIGPNGAGKSTLLKTMAGLHKRFSGSVHISGKRLEHLRRKERARSISLVSQLTGSDFPFRVRDVVMSGRAPHQGILGIENKKDTMKVDDVLAVTDTMHLKHKWMSRLSGGERQRVFIAAALCQDPSIMLLDEPTSALDLSHQTGILDLLEQLKTEKKMTLVMTMHDINLAAIYADRILILKKGRQVACGTVEQVLSKEILESVYECPLHVEKGPWADLPRLAPIPEKFRPFFNQKS